MKGKGFPQIGIIIERLVLMKHINPILLTGTLIGMVGCASPTRVMVLEPIGPGPGNQPQSQGEGSLQVYSARQKAPVDVNIQEWRWNNDFGKNDFLYEPAHTDYFLYSKNGSLLKQVRNAHNPNDSPVQVLLPAGSYEIRAEAEDCAGTVSVRVPVVIESGQTTTVHLVGSWRPRRHFSDSEVVRLPDGQIAGWLALQ